MTAWLWVLRLILADTIAAALGFAVPFGLRLVYGGGQHDRVMGWHVLSYSLATAIEAAAFEALLFGVRMPVWVYVIPVGLVGFVANWRLALYLLPAIKRRGRNGR